MSAILLLDTFTGADATEISAHTPDTPGAGSYANNLPGVFALASNKLKVSTNFNDSPGGDFGTSPFRNAFTDFTLAGMDLHFESYMDVEIVTTAAGDGNGPFIHLIGRHNGQTIGSGLQAYFGVLLRQSTASLAEIVFRRQSANTNAQIAVVGSLAIGNGGSIRLGYSLRADAALLAWTEPHGGGARTYYDPVTLTDEYDDGTQRRFGIAVRSVAGVTVDYRITEAALYLPPPAAPARVLAR